jgi:hypothetical protein
MPSEDVPRAYWVDAQVIEKITNITETLANLNYLIHLEADNPRVVRSYSSQADERLRTLGKLLHSIYA